MIVALTCCAGCRPTIESSDLAEPLPPATRDPRENEVDAQRWPGWRGANASGIAPAGSPAVHFDPSKAVRWKVAIEGRGNSSPVVWDDAVLLTTALEDTDPVALEILCFDRADGELLWQKEVGKAQGPSHNKNGFASASVATDGRGIFAFFGSTGLFCYDFSGNRRWRAELGNLDHIWGTASSPVLYGELVIQLCDSGADSYIAAFEKSTGRQVWSTPRPSNGCWSTPVLVEVDAEEGRRSELVVNGTGSELPDERLVIAYDPDDGRELWRAGGMTQFVTPTPMTGGGLVYCASGRNGPVLAIRSGGAGDVTDTHVVWKLHRGGPYVPTGVVYRNRLYLVNDGGYVACYNAGSGQRIWRHRLRGSFTASLVAADGRIYAVNQRGVVYVFAAADSFELLGDNDMRANCLATPAVAGGDLFIRTDGHLYCIKGQL